MQTKIGVLITNLGTPAAPTPAAVKSYLAEFLSDPRVVEIPRFLWLPLLYGLILRTRPKKSAALYKKIWTEQGSPLLVHSQNLVSKLKNKLSTELFTVALGMRYGEPSLEQALNQLKQAEINKLLILPLYPQYSGSTTASTFDQIGKILKTWRVIPEIQFISQYYHHTAYLSAWQQHLNNYKNLIDNHYLLFSFHGLPERFVKSGDPYQQQCLATAQNIATTLKLNPDRWSVAFQSRFGRAKWLEPYCDATLKNLPKIGKKRITVVCPGFAVDCLETLEEIALQNKAIFLNSGGEQFNYIPCLNASDLHVELLAKIIKP